jgi:hypothetical protein
VGEFAKVPDVIEAQLLKLIHLARLLHVHPCYLREKTGLVLSRGDEEDEKKTESGCES